MKRDTDKDCHGLFDTVREYVLSPKKWFWVHKILIIAYTLSVCAWVPDADNVFFTENKEVVFDHYWIYPDTLVRAHDMLRSLIFHSLLRVVLFALICFTWGMSIRAFKKQVTDYDHKKNYFADGKNLLDILLNIMTIVVFLRANGAVNYTFLSADSGDCGFWSKVSLYSKISRDMEPGVINEKGMWDEFSTDEITVRYGDIELCREPVEYHPSDVLPLEFSLPLPGGREFAVWWSRTEAESTGSFFGGLFFYLDNERNKTIWLYCLKCGDIILPLDKWSYDNFTNLGYNFNVDDDTLIRIEYYENSHIIYGNLFDIVR